MTLRRVLYFCGAICAFALCAIFFTGRPDNPGRLVGAERDLDVFIDGWNAAVAREKLPAKFELSGDKAANAAAVKETLAEWTRPFHLKPGPDYERELNKLARVAPRTTFHAYEDFRRAHYRDAPMEIPATADDEILAKIVNEYAGGLRNGRAPDYVTGETAANVAQMNSLRVFWERNGKDLRARGVDSAIERFADIKTGGRFPWLDALADE